MPFQYAVLRVVPNVERGERVNAGVVLLCRPARFLEARIELDEALVAALAPGVDLAPIRRILALVPAVCAGDPDAGPIARLEPPERFHWVVAPSSTVVQPSAVHTGLTDDPGATLAWLVRRLVRRPAARHADDG
ncbi:MAG: DUF3037 domain-containing protein [Chloroflexota bacterium]